MTSRPNLTGNYKKKYPKAGPWTPSKSNYQGYTSYPSYQPAAKGGYQGGYTPRGGYPKGGKGGGHGGGKGGKGKGYKY